MQIKLGGPICSPENITNIECRTVDGLLSIKEANVDAECSIEKGLFCRQPKEKPCPDFEIRVYCQCSKFWLKKQNININIMNTKYMFL